MEHKLTDRTLKRILLLGSGLVLGYCAYSVYKIWKKSLFISPVEGSSDISKIERSRIKRILFLGLSNAGKTTILSQIPSGQVLNRKDLKPTQIFEMRIMERNGICINIWEIGGHDDLRKHWQTFLKDIDILVFVIDASDVHNISLSIKEIRLLLADDRLTNVPLLIIANKQDLPSAIPPQFVANALNLKSIPCKHKVQVLGTQTPVNAIKRHPSIAKVDKTLLLMINE